MDEAFDGDEVGLMAEGRLLVRDSPKDIVERTGTRGLEEAFLKLAKDGITALGRETTQAGEATPGGEAA